jgi:hypothetical protein
VFRGIPFNLQWRAWLVPRLYRLVFRWHRCWDYDCNCNRTIGSTTHQLAPKRPRDWAAIPRSICQHYLLCLFLVPDRTDLVLVDRYSSYNPLDLAHSSRRSFWRWKLSCFYLRFELFSWIIRNLRRLCARWKCGCSISTRWNLATCWTCNVQSSDTTLGGNTLGIGSDRLDSYPVRVL